MNTLSFPAKKTLREVRRRLSRSQIVQQESELESAAKHYFDGLNDDERLELGFLEKEVAPKDEKSPDFKFVEIIELGVTSIGLGIFLWALMRSLVLLVGGFVVGLGVIGYRLMVNRFKVFRKS